MQVNRKILGRSFIASQYPLTQYSQLLSALTTFLNSSGTNGDIITRLNMAVPGQSTGQSTGQNQITHRLRGITYPVYEMEV